MGLKGGGEEGRTWDQNMFLNLLSKQLGFHYFNFPFAFIQKRNKDPSEIKKEKFNKQELILKEVTPRTFFKIIFF